MNSLALKNSPRPGLDPFIWDYLLQSKDVIPLSAPNLSPDFAACQLPSFFLQSAIDVWISLKRMSRLKPPSVAVMRACIIRR